MARDISAGVDTTGRVRPEGFVRGVIDTRRDHDWFRVELDPGSYVIRLGGTGERPLGHPLLILRDEDGRVEAREHFHRGEARLVGAVEESKTYYLDVSGLDPRTIPRGEEGAGRKIGYPTGDYVLSVNRLDGSPLDAIAGAQWIEKRVVKVHFAPNGATGEFDGGARTEESAGWNGYQIRRAMAALDTFSDVCDLSFRQTHRRTTADFDLLLHGGPHEEWAGIFQPPGTIGEGTGIFAGGPDAIYHGEWADRPGRGLENGTFGWELMLHEFCHGLGLAHPHDFGAGSVVMDGIKPPDRHGSYPYRQGDFGLNSTRFTVMSYRDEGDPDRSPLLGYAMGPMAFDIAALQQMYGATRSHRGNDSYILPDRNAVGTGYLCIWDTGGEDTIRAGRTDRDVTVNLNAATLAYEPGGGGFLSSARGVHGGYTIANGVLLENASGGDGDDGLVGNGLDNWLGGDAGADRFRGGAGADRLVAGDDNTHDVFVYRARSDSGVAGAEADRIAGFDVRSGRRETTWDRVDLSAFDGDPDVRGNQPLRFVPAFSAPGIGDPSGQVRAERRGDDVHILIDLDGDSAADMRLVLLDTARLHADDFFL